MLAGTHPLLRVARFDSACAKKNNVLQVALERKVYRKSKSSSFVVGQRSSRVGWLIGS